MISYINNIINHTRIIIIILLVVYKTPKASPNPSFTTVSLLPSANIYAW